MLTQIYGITTAADAALVNELGPDHVGVVLDEGIDTWDSVDVPALRAILPELRDVAVVALSLSTERDRIHRTAEAVDPAWVHLARAAGALGPEMLARLREEVAPRRLMLTIPVRDENAIGPGCRLRDPHEPRRRPAPEGSGARAALHRTRARRGRSREPALIRRGVPDERPRLASTSGRGAC